LVEQPNGVWRLRITLDARYPEIINEACRSVRELLPANRIGTWPRIGCVDVGAYSRQLRCWFPQHGSGPKHLRPIHLEPWQEHLVALTPKNFLRGLIHSDGCRFVNRVRRGSRAYAYPRYTFTNHSADIRALFCRTCDCVGIEWRAMNATTISVARRRAVARLDSFVGPKH